MHVLVLLVNNPYKGMEATRNFFKKGLEGQAADMFTV